MSEKHPKIYLYRRIVQAKRFIDEHFSEPLVLDCIANEAYFSKFHFMRLFKRIYNKTPHQYLIYVRITRARQLLKENKPVSEVCYAVGFESLSSFSGLFKRITGETPSSYLRQQQKIKARMKTSPLDFVPGCFAEKNGWLKN